MLQSGQQFTMDDFVRELNLGRRTIFRDLQELGHLGIPFKFDHTTKCYLIDKSFFMPSMNFNQAEALSILLMSHKMRNQITIPYRDSVLAAALKIENHLSSELKRYCATALRHISIKSMPQSQTDLLDKTFLEIQNAITNRKILQFAFCDNQTDGNLKTEFHPYHLMYHNGSWQVFGFSEYHKNITSFKLNRISKLISLDKCFVDDDKFDVYDYIGRAWATKPEGQLYFVKLLFSPEIARDVAEVHWHSSQLVTLQNDGSALLEFRVDGLNEIIWWILSYGDKVVVLAPATLRNKIKNMISNTQKLYNGPQDEGGNF